MLRIALTAALLAAAPALATALPQADGKLEDLLSELARERDDADPDKLYDVAAIGSRDAMEGLVGLYTEFSSIFMRREVLRALTRFFCKQKTLFYKHGASRVLPARADALFSFFQKTHFISWERV